MCRTDNKVSYYYAIDERKPGDGGMNHGRETDKIYLHPKINRIICRISINYLSCIMLNLKCYRDEKVFSEINAVSGIGFGGVIRVFYFIG